MEAMCPLVSMVPNMASLEPHLYALGTATSRSKTPSSIICQWERRKDKEFPKQFFVGFGSFSLLVLLHR